MSTGIASLILSGAREPDAERRQREPLAGALLRLRRSETGVLRTCLAR